MQAGDAVSAESRVPPMKTIKCRFCMIGTICLFLIIPIKAFRWVGGPIAHTILVGIAPSLLAPAGFMFLILSSSGRISRLTLPQLSLSMLMVSLLTEFVQLLPRPGVLAMVHYTFDWYDVMASFLSVGVGYLGAKVLLSQTRTN